jgi:predicted nucleic acid-binding protein
MMLVDTSVWIGHLRTGDPALVGILEADLVVTHSLVIGELSCGDLKHRADTLRWLRALPQATAAADEEVGLLIEERKLYGKGIGWLDAHLIASALLTNCRLWTLDGRLAVAAKRAGVRRFAAG